MIAKLRGGTIASYPDSVLEGHLLKCDEFDGIHKLKTARPHPAVWNFRQVRSRLISARSGRRAVHPQWTSSACFSVPLMTSEDF